MNRLILVDGHNLLFQMFFGMPSKIVGKGGQPIQGVIGFIGAINRIINAYQPTHLCVIFDGESGCTRKEILEDYKANRPDWSSVSDDENPFTQLPYIYDALDYMGVKHAETIACETDDVIASYALKYGMDCEVIISSFDSDYFQLINKNVKVLRYRGDSSLLCDEKYIFDKYGITPEGYLDYKCLVGDTADNVKGVKGVGPKTASKLINTYGDLESIIERASEIESERIRLAITDSVQILKRNVSLIKLAGGADIPFPLDEVKFDSPSMRTMEIIRGIGI